MNNVRIQRALKVAAALASLLPLFSYAQDESRRFKSGQVKVGDNIMANPTNVGAMESCTVLEIVPDPVRAGYDGDYVIKCEHSWWTRVSATGDHSRIIPQTSAIPAQQVPQNPATSAYTRTTTSSTSRPNTNANALPATQPVTAGGNAFGTRNPRTCPNFTGSTPSNAVAAQLVACYREGQSRQNMEYIVGNVTVTSMTTSKYDPHTQTGFTNMDTGVAPIAIRGTVDSWACRPQDGPAVMAQYSNVGHNCTKSSEPNATGYCYKLRTGAWSCAMNDTTGSMQSQYNVAPPK